MKALQAGQRLEHRRRITEEDVRRFAELSGDKGAHHVEPDAKGRLMAHGLLTASLPTKLGGDLDFVARAMRFEFLKPVYSGDELTCVGTVESLSPRPGRVRAELSFVVTNQDGERVLQGDCSGVIYAGKTPPTL